MDEEKIKGAFLKVKGDILILEDEIISIKNELTEIKQILTKLNLRNNTNYTNPLSSTLRHINPTNSVNSTDTSTHPQEIGGLKNPNLTISTGNEGVSTDRQTDTSTDTSTHNLQEKPQKTIETNIQEASEILESLDNLKKEIRRKFKRVTSQEMAVFSTIYQLEEQNPLHSNYKEISIRLNLSQSSIRDYVQKMINKGIPIKKQKIDNKKIILSISSELKKIAPLSTIIQLRGL